MILNFSIKIINNKFLGVSRKKIKKKFLGEGDWVRTQKGLKINTRENRGPQCKKAVREQQHNNNSNNKLK